MKRVRIMLSLVALCTVVGGALAFKTKSAYGVTIYTSTVNSGCTIETKNTTTTTTPNAGGQFYVATTSGGSCPTSYYLKAKD